MLRLPIIISTTERIEAKLMSKVKCFENREKAILVWTRVERK